jgi:VanZ family protein
LRGEGIYPPSPRQELASLDDVALTVPPFRKFNPTCVSYMHRAPSESPGLVALRQAGEQNSSFNVRRRIYGGLCICTLCTILLAGLWPFRAPKNEVEWLRGKNGLQFGHRGIAQSIKAFHTETPNGPCSLEIMLQPANVTGSGTILAFDDSAVPRNSFALRQFDGSLAIQRPGADAQGKIVRSWWKTDRVFAKSKRVVLTVIFTPGKTLLYVDGIHASTSSDFGLVDHDLTGRLVLGNSMTQDSWAGQITGLAVYHVALTPSQVEQNAARWTQGLMPLANSESAPTALYLFDERKGNVVHDQTSSGNSLEIPARYFIVHPNFLAPVWEQYQSRWDGWMTRSYWADVLLNIAGFVPLGFFLAGYLSFTKLASRSRVLSLLSGFTISLAIEAAQYLLPTRDSSMTDLLANMIGTIVGILLYRQIRSRRILVIAS